MMELAPTLGIALVSSVTAIIVALISHFPLRRGVKAAQQDAAVTREQVQNSHKTNLRDDIDIVMDKISEVLTVQRSTSNDVRQLREDLAIERRERLAVADRVDDLRELLA